MHNRSLIGMVLIAHVSAQAAESAGVGNLPFDAAVASLASTFADLVLPVVIIPVVALIAFYVFAGHSPARLIPILGAPIALIGSVHVLNLVAASTAQHSIEESSDPTAGAAVDWLSQYGWMVGLAIVSTCALIYAVVRSNARKQMQEALKRDKRDLLAAIDLADQAQRYWNARQGQIYASDQVQGAQAARQALLVMLSQVHDGHGLSAQQQIAFRRAEAQIVKIAVDEFDRPLMAMAAAGAPPDNRAVEPRSLPGDASIPRRTTRSCIAVTDSVPEAEDRGLLTTLLSASVFIDTAAAADFSSKVESDSSDRQFECRTSTVGSSVASESAGAASWGDSSSHSSCDPGPDLN